MIPVALILLFTGPWLVYLVTPVPDQLAEYRNYSMVAAFALFASQLPWFLWPALLLYFIAMTHHHASAWTDQITFWKRALATTSGDPSRAYQEVGAFLKITGRNEEAEPYFIEAIRLNPKLAPALENLANVYLMSGRPDDGLKTVEVLIERCPHYASGWQTHGLLAEQRGLDAVAIASYARAIALQPCPQAVNHLGLIAFREQRFADALSWFTRAEAQHPTEATFLYNKAMTFYALGRTAEADEIKNRFNGVPIQWNPEMVPQPPQPQPELQPC